MNLGCAGQLFRTQSHQSLTAPHREEQTNSSRSQGQKEAFGQQLLDQAIPSGSERRADRDFAGSSRGASEQQIRNIDAGNQ